eukprot:SM000046S16410  [mRNA]  locus=s46:398777:401110:- [translate_table: standard]
MILALLITNKAGNVLLERSGTLRQTAPPLGCGRLRLEIAKKLSFLALSGFDPDEGFQVSRFQGLPAEERGQWRSFLVKLGVENLPRAREEEDLVAHHRSVHVVYSKLGEVGVFAVGKDEYNDAGLLEVINAVTQAIKHICKRAPTEAIFLDKYGRICLALEEIVAQGIFEHTDKERIRRLAKLKPLPEA